jgi:5,10-methylene-tetrahydrofolate dehydrogenase/methenyl tetrahydrofolate cyclohydrolase
MAESKNIDGNAIAATIRTELKADVDAIKNEFGVTPGLAVVLVGERRDSATYVRSKKKACAEIGITSFGIDYPADVSEAELIAKVDELNSDPAVHGILVQLPLPSHIDEKAVLDRISQEKDVDGLHPLNIAGLCNTKTHGGRSEFSFAALDFHVACTPQGCIELLDRSGVTISGKDAVVLGRSNIVGIPVALLLMQRNATVTIAHSRTKNIEEVVRRADIVVCAVGRTEMVKGSWIKPGAVVIDVGINSKDDPTDKRGYKLVGDAEFESCKENASLITPVPGGVGPMTIAMLLRNTVNGTRRKAIADKAGLPPLPPTDA